VANTHLPPQWRERLLAIVNGHGWDTGLFYPEGLRLLDAWQRAEGGTAQWNPLNTTFYLPGSTNYNTANVKNYMRATDGVCATGLTLVNGFYNGILGDLQNGAKTAEQIVADRADQFRTWGTDPAVIARVLAT
jgi:hypothetical protein